MVKTKRNTIIPVPFTVWIALATAGALFYLWMCGRCEMLGEMLKNAEQEQVELRRRHDNESRAWANMRAPENIERALKQHGLTMNWPTRDQIIRLHDVRVDRTYSLVGLRGGLR